MSGEARRAEAFATNAAGLLELLDEEGPPNANGPERLEEIRRQAGFVGDEDAQDHHKLWRYIELLEATVARPLTVVERHQLALQLAQTQATLAVYYRLCANAGVDG